MVSRSIWILCILLFPFLLEAQTEIEVVFENGQPKNPVPIVLQSGENYQIKIIGFNPVFIRDRIRIRSLRYISPTPEVLRPILPAISGSNVFQDYIKFSAQREFFPKALHYFNELEVLRSESDDLYTRTRLVPDPVLAAEKMEKIKSLFDTDSYQEMVRRIHYYQDYILAAESVYETNVKKITLKTIDTDIILQEFVRLTRIGDQMDGLDYVELLDYIVRSTHAQSFILSDVFMAEKDLTEVSLGLYDAYIQDTVYTGKLTFQTKYNWSFDFSTGFIFTNIYDKVYYLMDQEDNPNYIQEENKFKGDVSIGAFAHFTYRIEPKIRIGPSIGASISPFDRNIRYLAGLSIFAGSERLVGISGGVSLGQVEVLSGMVQRDGQGYFLPSGESKIPVYSRIKTGYFIGLTYNLTRKKYP